MPGRRTDYSDRWIQRERERREMLVSETSELDDCGRASRSRYSQGCRCRACKAAVSRYERERRKRKAREEWGAEQPAFVDAEPVRERLLYLRAMGYTVEEVHRISGVGKTAQHNLTVGHWRTGEPVKRVKRETAEAIMAIEPGKRRLSAGQRVPGAWMGDTVRGWKAAGLSVARISRETGIDRQVLDRVSKLHAPLVEAGTLHRFVLAVPKMERIVDALAEERRGYSRKGENRG